MSTPDPGAERLTKRLPLSDAWLAEIRDWSGLEGSVTRVYVNSLLAEVQRLREMERNVRAVPRHQSSIFYMNGGGDNTYSEMTWVIKVSDLDAALGDAK